MQAKSNAAIWGAENGLTPEKAPSLKHGRALSEAFMLGGPAEAFASGRDWTRAAHRNHGTSQQVPSATNSRGPREGALVVVSSIALRSAGPSLRPARGLSRRAACRDVTLQPA